MRRFTLTCIVIFLSSPSTYGLDVAGLVKQVEQSVVRIDTESSFGSGVVIHDQGLVLTSFHLVDGESSVVVILRSGERLNSHGFLAVDPAHDLALIKTDALKSPAAVKMADSLTPKIGEKVVAFGSPKGFRLTTSEGTVSAVQTGAALKDVMGPDSYQYLGCSKDTTWIQSTAQVSTANNGGPLVNMSGELVGVNSWVHPQNPELNFAIGLPEIMRLLTLRQNKSARGSALAGKSPPTGKETAPASTKARVQSRELKLPLRTERVFTYELFNSPRVGVGGVSKGDDVTLTYPSGALYAAAKHANGKLHGPTAAQYESGAPMAYVAFDKGTRNGILKTWTESGDPILMSQYSNGRLAGFACFHVASRLALIVQYRFDEPELIQMMSGHYPLESYLNRADADKNPIARDLLAQMEEYDVMLKRNEFRFKNQVRELEADRRKALAAKLAPEKRARIQQRANARSNANDAAIQQLYRQAGW